MEIIDLDARAQAMETAKALEPLLKEPAWKKYGFIVMTIGAIAAIIGSIFTIIIYFK